MFRLPHVESKRAINRHGTSLNTSFVNVKLRYDVIRRSHVLNPTCNIVRDKNQLPTCAYHIKNKFSFSSLKLNYCIMHILNICSLHHKMFLKPSYDAFYSLVFFLPPIFSFFSVKTTSDGAGSVVRSTWLLFHRTSLSCTQSTSNASPVQPSKSGAVCFCHSCPSPCFQTWCLRWDFISKHMLDVIIPYGLIFASF